MAAQSSLTISTQLRQRLEIVPVSIFRSFHWSLGEQDKERHEEECTEGGADADADYDGARKSGGYDYGSRRGRGR